MNKNLYRVVFNQARGMLMVVPEIARATGTAASGTGHTLSRLIGKVSALSFSLWLALGAIQPAQADIVANGAAAKNQQPTIVAAANGTPQVNIQTPSGAGVSRNSFSRFDVDQKGVILNNATRMTQSELAGMVAANPWLARGEAKVILNEVSSRDPSRLNGIIEVAGQRAQVVIASPAGITCDGCGFINASRTTLTTGQVQMTGGQISGYDVQRGEIVIDGRGMDSTRADSTDLIARAVKVNAGIWAKDLKVSAGRNVVDAAHQTVTATGGDDSPRPQFAVDVAQLGGMYARKIHLRGTERGVGVRNAGVIGASAGDVVVNADGTLTHSGQIQAHDAIHLTSRSGIQSSGVLAAGITPDGGTNPVGDLTLTSEGALRISGQNQAPGRLSASGTTLDFSASQSRAAHIELTASRGDILTTGAGAEAQTLTARTPGRLDNDGGNLTADRLDITARQLSNRGGALQQRGDSDLTLAHQDGIDNRGGVIASAGKNLTLSGASLDNRQGRVQGNALAIHAATGSINNQQGTLTASGGLNLQSVGLNNDAGLVQAGSALNVDLHGGALSNRDSGESGGLLSLGTFTLNGGALDNTRGYIAAAGDSLISGLALDNTHGTLYSESHLRLTTDALTNAQGLIQAGKNLTLDTRGQALINDQGRISAGQSLALYSGALSNQSGQMVAGDAMALTAQDSPLDNRQGMLAAGGNMQLTGSGLSNQSGQIQSAGAMAIDARTLVDNAAGLIRSGKTTAITTLSLLNRNTSGENAGIEGLAVVLTAPALDNRDGAIRSSDSLIVNTLTLLDNTRGLLSSAGELDVRGGNSLALTNTGGTLIAGMALNLSAASASGDGRLLSQDAMQLSLQKAFTNAGEIIANGSITFTLAKGLTNESLIKAGESLVLTAKNLTNKENAEISAGENHLLIDGTLTNRGLLDGGLTHLTAATLSNLATGRIYGDRVALAAATLNNEAKKGVAPVIAARERLDIAAGTINNSGHALIYSAGDMAIGGQLDAQYQAQGQAQILNNTGATVESAGNMLLGIATLNNRNAGMKTRVVVVENSTRHEASLAGSADRFDWADIYVGNKNKYGVHQATMPDGTRGREFYSAFSSSTAWSPDGSKVAYVTFESAACWKPQRANRTWRSSISACRTATGWILFATCDSGARCQLLCCRRG
jgi:filamentous hemagglutinin